MPPIVVYLTGFRQHAGKTVTSLGLISQLRKHIRPGRIGYLKPVGQEMVTLSGGMMVDKDVELIKQFAGIPYLRARRLSPVRFTSGFTREYLDADDQAQRTEELARQIRESVASLGNKQVIVAEGSGHPGVGSVVGLSNAVVGNLLDAEILFVSAGGIGQAIDMLDVDLSYFLYQNCRVRAVLFNKVIPDKVPQMRRYVTEELLNNRYEGRAGRLSILGYLPQIPYLDHPSMRILIHAFDDPDVIGDPDDDEWEAPCGAVRVVSLTAEHLKLDHYVKPRDLVVISASSTTRIRAIISHQQSLREQGSIGGLLLTCGETESLDDYVRHDIERARIPAMLIHEDSATSEARIFNAYRNTKLQVFDAPKIASIEALFDEHFETERFLEIFGIS